ncbi:Uncharacterised protein [Mycobacterium tuberculosis]|nr:Uncharacterised protein [Mycobacterium tuberculosis]
MVVSRMPWWPVNRTEPLKEMEPLPPLKVPVPLDQLNASEE